MERANYWTEGEEPGCRRGSNNRTKEKDSCGEVRIAAGRGTERSGQTVLLSMANRIIVFLLLTPLLNHCSPGLKKATCRPSATAALSPMPQTEKQREKRAFLCTRVCVTGDRTTALEDSSTGGSKRRKLIYRIAWGYGQNGVV